MRIFTVTRDSLGNARVIYICAARCACARYSSRAKTAQKYLFFCTFWRNPFADFDDSLEPSSGFSLPFLCISRRLDQNWGSLLQTLKQTHTITQIIVKWALHRPMHVLYTRRVSVITVTGLPFDQMEPSRSMQTRSGNPVRNPKLERDFPDFWIEFYAGFYEWVNDWLMTNYFKQYLSASGVYFGLLFQTYFKSSRSV